MGKSRITGGVTGDILGPLSGGMKVNLEKFFMDFQDHLAPRLDTYEQAIYFYIFRHSRLLGKDEVVIGLKSARTRMACGVGEKGKPMSEGTAHIKLLSLAEKGCVEIRSSERFGRRVHLSLPHEIPGVIPEDAEAPPASLDEMDFFEVPENRLLILERENHRCFYCLREINGDTYVMEHVVSRPQGNNSYRNIVAACRQCNNRKKTSAEDLLRTLYRESFLDAAELEDRLSHLERLRSGELKPAIPGRDHAPRAVPER